LRLRRVLELFFLILFVKLGIPVLFFLRLDTGDEGLEEGGEEGGEDGGEICPYRLLKSEVFSLYNELQAC
jgi:hypothetical protein